MRGWKLAGAIRHGVLPLQVLVPTDLKYDKYGIKYVRSKTM